LKDKQVLDNTDVLFGVDLPVVLDSTGNVQEGPTNYTFVGDDFPTLLFRLAFGTPVLRIDLVESNIKFKGSLNTRAPTSTKPFFSFPDPTKKGTFAQVAIVGSLTEVDWITRNDEFDNPDLGLAVTNTFANGSAIPDGSYRALIRALRVTGDPTNEADYESWLSPIIGFTA